MPLPVSRLETCLNLYYVMKVILQVVIFQLQVKLQKKKKKTVVVCEDNDCFVLICSFHCRGQFIFVIEIFNDTNNKNAN